MIFSFDSSKKLLLCLVAALCGVAPIAQAKGGTSYYREKFEANKSTIIIASLAAAAFAGVAFMAWWNQETDEQFADRMKREFGKFCDKNTDILKIFETDVRLKQFDGVVMALMSRRHYDAVTDVFLEDMSKLNDIKAAVSARIAKIGEQSTKPAAEKLKKLRKNIAVYLKSESFVRAHQFLQDHKSYIRLRGEFNALLVDFEYIIQRFKGGDYNALEALVRSTASPYPHVTFVKDFDFKISIIGKRIQMLSKAMYQFKECYDELHHSATELKGNLTSIKDHVILHPEYTRELRQQKKDQLEQERINIQHQQAQAQADMAYAMGKQANAMADHAHAAQMNALNNMLNPQQPAQTTVIVNK
jgi:hypothetical protein